MYISKNKKSKKKLILLIIVAILLSTIVALVSYIYFTKNDTNNNQPAVKEVTADRSESDKIQEDKLHENPDNKSISNNSDVADPIENSSNGKSIIPLVASTDSSIESIFIRGGINTISNEGQCYAQLTGPNGESVRVATELIQNPSSTDCKTITIKKSGLSKGQWSFTLNFESPQLQGKTDAIKFSI